MFEECSQPTAGTWKWGVVVGIRKDIQIINRVQITDAVLKGRVVAVDIALPDDTGGAFRHRIFGVYAPWDPGEKPRFWAVLTTLVRSTPHGWSLSGDLNATVSALERATSENRQPFLSFLEDCNAIDVWSLNSSRTRAHDWTCCPKKDGKRDAREGNIIDRLVVSRTSTIEATVFVADKPQEFVPRGCPEGISVGTPTRTLNLPGPAVRVRVTRRNYLGLRSELLFVPAADPPSNCAGGSDVHDAHDTHN
ncbi:hypothetical protein BDZ89DRAFT_1117046 [Hymenopellis radicata]|nr:hypothetical protein BDZ89DRAFT_1117046 [Hymenopellis radicata]